ncbi:MAG: DUF1840 domain-containing protein [Rubrivivax sp.]
MIYKFKSKATGDLVMLQPQGDQLLRLLGREPAARGIIEVAAMPAALAALEAAVAADETPNGDDDETPGRSISLRQRVWPMVEMLKRALAEQQPVVWGV